MPVCRSGAQTRAGCGFQMILKRIIYFLLVLVCLAVIGGGIYYFLSASGSLPPLSLPAVENAVVVVTTAPFQPLVTYPDGNKTGFDPATGDKVIRIPLSRYYFESDNDNPEPGSFWLGLTSPPDSFSLQILGENGGEFGFGFYSFQDGRQLTQTFTGQIISANSVFYQVTKNPSGPFPWQITPVK